MSESDGEYKLRRVGNRIVREEVLAPVSRAEQLASRLVGGDMSKAQAESILSYAVDNPLVRQADSFLKINKSIDWLSKNYIMVGSLVLLLLVLIVARYLGLIQLLKDLFVAVFNVLTGMFKKGTGAFRDMASSKKTLLYG